MNGIDPDSSSTVHDLRRLVELDPVLSSRVLQMANSAYFGLPRQVTDLHRAIVMLGFSTVRNLALTACLKSLYRDEFRCGTFTAGSLWLHSVATGVIARTLAQHLHPDLADEAFLCGIVHDIGIIVEWTLLPERFPAIVRAFDGMSRPFRDAEKEALGFEHCTAGGTVLRRWGLPRELVHVARHHHDGNDQSGPGRRAKTKQDRLAGLVHLAECVCAERSNGFFDEPRNDEVTSRLLADAGRGPEEYGRLVETAEKELERARELLTH